MKKQQGFTLLEIFISLAIGSVLLAGVLSVFVGMRTTTEDTSSLGELQENGRFALSILTDDLQRQGFWGDFSGGLSRSVLQVTPLAPTSTECRGEGINNGTFPRALGHFRTLWGRSATSANNMSCAKLDDAKVGSDIIQIKRVVAAPLEQNADGSLAEALDAKRYYLLTNSSDGAIFSGTTAIANIPNVENGQYWQYQHHIYFVEDQSQGQNSVPVLMQGRLTDGLVFEPLIDGIEMIYFTYGVDTDGDGVVNAFISADNMLDRYWDNNAINLPNGQPSNIAILAVNIYVLARSILPDSNYENTNSYQMGDKTVSFVNNAGEGDNYRRMLFSSTVTLYNARVDSWQD